MPRAILEAAFPPNPARVKCHIPRFRGDGGGRDFYVADAQMKLTCIPMTADVYRAGTFRAKKKRTKEINFAPRPPRYVMDGSGRDGFVFLHGDVGQAPKRVFRTNSTPWGQNASSCPYAFDPNLRHAAKCSSLRRRIPTNRATCTGFKVVAKNPYRRHAVSNLPAKNKNSIRRARRQAKSSNRLSTPIPRLVVKNKQTRPGTAAGREKNVTPWLGNSKRPRRPATASSGFTPRKTRFVPHHRNNVTESSTGNSMLGGGDLLFASIDKTLLN